MSEKGPEPGPTSPSQPQTGQSHPSTTPQTPGTQKPGVGTGGTKPAQK